MPELFVIFFFITVMALGPFAIIFGYLRSRRRSINKQELQHIQNDMARMRADIEDIKEQLADFIIRTH